MDGYDDNVGDDGENVVKSVNVKEILKQNTITSIEMRITANGDNGDNSGIDCGFIDAHPGDKFDDFFFH